MKLKKKYKFKSQHLEIYSNSEIKYSLKCSYFVSVSQKSNVIFRKYILIDMIEGNYYDL